MIWMFCVFLFLFSKNRSGHTTSFLFYLVIPLLCVFYLVVIAFSPWICQNVCRSERKFQQSKILSDRLVSCKIHIQGCQMPNFIYKGCLIYQWNCLECRTVLKVCTTFGPDLVCFYHISLLSLSKHSWWKLQLFPFSCFVCCFALNIRVFLMSCWDLQGQVYSGYNKKHHKRIKVASALFESNMAT